MGRGGGESLKAPSSTFRNAEVAFFSKDQRTIELIELGFGCLASAPANLLKLTPLEPVCDFRRCQEHFRPNNRRSSQGRHLQSRHEASAPTLMHQHTPCNTRTCDTRALTQPMQPIQAEDNLSSCQSAALTGCLLLLAQQYIKTQRGRHLLPVSLLPASP